MEIIRDLDMTNETVRLDGRHFIDCTFSDCVLEYGGSEFVLERTLMRNCRHAFYGSAFLTTQYLSTIGLLSGDDLVIGAELMELVH